MGDCELTWVTGYIPRWFTRPQTITDPSTNPPVKSDAKAITLPRSRYSNTHDTRSRNRRKSNPIFGADLRRRRRFFVPYASGGMKIFGAEIKPIKVILYSVHCYALYWTDNKYFDLRTNVHYALLCSVS